MAEISLPRSIARRARRRRGRCPPTGDKTDHRTQNAADHVPGEHRRPGDRHGAEPVDDALARIGGDGHRGGTGRVTAAHQDDPGDRRSGSSRGRAAASCRRSTCSPAAWWHPVRSKRRTNSAPRRLGEGLPQAGHGDRGHGDLVSTHASSWWVGSSSDRRRASRRSRHSARTCGNRSPRKSAEAAGSASAARRDGGASGGQPR
jgi:hypothetical protein